MGLQLPTLNFILRVCPATEAPAGLGQDQAAVPKARKLMRRKVPPEAKKEVKETQSHAKKVGSRVLMSYWQDILIYWFLRFGTF